MPKISFVMPTKNRDKLIGKAIQSIVAQTEQDWELIIVDDHSDKSDKTEEMVAAFNDSRISYYRIPDNWGSGIAEARNFGNQLAHSPIIAVCDSDDLNNPNRAELTIKAFAQNNCDVFYGQVEIYNEETGLLTDRRKGKFPVIPFDLEKMKEYSFIPHGSVAYKTEIALDFPYNSFFKFAEDSDLLSRLAKFGKKFYFCDKIIYRYIDHASNETKKKNPGNFGKLIQIDRGWIDEDKRPLIKAIID